MPSTRANHEELWTGGDFSDSDPDYREDSAESDDDLPMTMGQDRAEWVRVNADAIAELYQAYRNVGLQLFGPAFFQCGDLTSFAHFTYKHTMVGATII